LRSAQVVKSAFVSTNSILSEAKAVFMNKFLALILAIGLSSVAVAQVETAAKEAGKATSETAKQAGHRAKAAVEPQPDKAVDKAKAKTHKAKAHHHAHAAKEASKDAAK
jgi:hypothetical protein